MNFNKTKKIILILMFGIVTFLTASSNVYATEDGQTLCKYEGDFGTIEIYIKFNHSKYAFKWKHTQVENCGGTVDNSCASINFEDDSFKSLDSSYDFGYNATTGVYVCPTLYYTYEQKNTWTGKYKKKFTFSPFAAGYSYSVTSSIVGQLESAYASEYEKLKDYGYNDLKRLLDGGNSSNIGNYFQSIGTPYVSKINKINDNIGCQVDQDYVNNKILEFKSTMQSLADGYIAKLKEVLAEKAASGELTASQASEIENMLDDAESQVNEAVDDMFTSVRNNVLSTYGTIIIDDSDIDCEGLLGDDVLNDISTLLLWIRIGVPILLILLGSLDFGKAVIADDPKALSKATSTFVKRAIAAVAVFFAPTIIMLLIRLVDDLAGGCDVNNLFKGVIMWKI